MLRHIWATIKEKGVESARDCYAQLSHTRKFNTVADVEQAVCAVKGFAKAAQTDLSCLDPNNEETAAAMELQLHQRAEQTKGSCTTQPEPS